jgi:Glycosyl hydrolase 36 superfamily, catalytic domain/Glycosyltransferase family 36
MSVNRRDFLATSVLAAAGMNVAPCGSDILLRVALAQDANSGTSVSRIMSKPFGSGYFGEWIEDEFGLPAFRYTCDQINDPKARTEINRGILLPTEHIHQVGNDRIVAIASNYGTVRVRQDEGAPKFLNDFFPDRGQFAGGFGYLTDGKTAFSTHYPGNGASFERLFGVGYYRRKLKAGDYSIDHALFAPFGDDPVLASQITITNNGNAGANLRWIEYWGCELYQFSFRSFMEGFSGKNMHDLRREFGARFEHGFTKLADASGLVEKKEFLGRDPAEDEVFKRLVANLEKNPDPFLAAPEKNVPKPTDFDDLNPPPTFLVSLDAPADGLSTNGKDFFSAGGVHNPPGLSKLLDGDLSKTGADSALLLERKFELKPGESRTLTFLYGYLPSGFDLDSLAKKYRNSAPNALKDSSEQWKKKGLRFSTDAEPWVEREVTWNHYYLRSGLTYDNFFHQHILSQASIYQYVMGFQGAARDPLQHALPFLFSDPEIIKEILRYTLKEVRPDGSIPYGIVGHGMIMPTASDKSSDMPLWLLWASSEYVLATRDHEFLDSEIVPSYGNQSREPVRGLLARCYRHLTDDVKTGKHGLMRMLHDDWNDALVPAWVPANLTDECVEKGESVMNSAIAAYVFDYYALMLVFAGDDGHLASQIRVKAEEHRKAVQDQWTGKWFRRAWLGPTLGWLGEKGLWLEPQPWAIIGRASTEEQTRTLIQTMDGELRKLSPIGAMQINDSPDRIANGVWKIEPGTSVTGGVWPSLNQTLIWALAQTDGAMAWDEWKKNSFARHAEVYPQIWYGTWSGPDVLNSASSKRPGETTPTANPFGWLDFPVLNMHAHACPLYSLSKLIGVSFTESGISLAPTLPLASFRFDSPLLGLIKTAQGYEGWYAPSVRNTYSIRLTLPADELKRFEHVEVNGNKIRPRVVDNSIELRGIGGAGAQLHWSATRG